MTLPDNLPGIIGLDHVGIAVDDMDAALAVYRDLLGFTVGEEEEMPDDQLRIVWCYAGTLAVELLESTGPNSPIARFLERRGPGVHHLGVRVTDIHAALDFLRSQGASLIDEKPRPGSLGTTIAFIHPGSTYRVLWELVQKD